MAGGGGRRGEEKIARRVWQLDLRGRLTETTNAAGSARVPHTFAAMKLGATISQA
jgi:hypothetical protein